MAASYATGRRGGVGVGVGLLDSPSGPVGVGRAASAGRATRRGQAGWAGAGQNSPRMRGKRTCTAARWIRHVGQRVCRLASTRACVGTPGPPSIPRSPVASLAPGRAPCARMCRLLAASFGTKPHACKRRLPVATPGRAPLVRTLRSLASAPGRARYARTHRLLVASLGTTPHACKCRLPVAMHDGRAPLVRMHRPPTAPLGVTLPECTAVPPVGGRAART